MCCPEPQQKKRENVKEEIQKRSSITGVPWTEGGASRLLAISANGRHDMLIAQANLAAMSRCFGFKIGAGPAVTTLRAGARTSSQTLVLRRAFGG